MIQGFASNLFANMTMNPAHQMHEASPHGGGRALKALCVSDGLICLRLGCFLTGTPPKDGSGATQKAQEPYDLCADGCRPEKQEEGLRVRVCSWTCSMLSCTDTDKQRDNGQRCLHYLGCKDLRFKGVTACRLKDPMVEGFTGCLVDDSFKIP